MRFSTIPEWLALGPFAAGQRMDWVPLTAIDGPCSRDAMSWAPSNGGHYRATQRWESGSSSSFLSRESVAAATLSVLALLPGGGHPFNASVRA